MENIANFAHRLMVLLVIACWFGSCNKDDSCEPQKHPPLTENEKSFIPNLPGDTLHFLDEAGRKYYLVCKSKDLSPVIYIPYGHENSPCPSIYQTWDKLTARFEGNLTTDQNTPISLEARIEGGFNPRDPEINISHKSGYKCTFYLFFDTFPKQSDIQQIFWGKSEENQLPIIINFGYKKEIKLADQLFQKVNLTSISSDYASVKYYFFGGFTAGPPGVDSVYYSGQYGLLRLTTKGGKKYQRIL